MSKDRYITLAQCAASFGVSERTFLGFCTISKPESLDSMYVKYHEGSGNCKRMYELKGVIDWLRQAAPEKFTDEVETNLRYLAERNERNNYQKLGELID